VKALKCALSKIAALYSTWYEPTSLDKAIQVVGFITERLEECLTQMKNRARRHLEDKVLGQD
jgi:hypothetical protein